jgi:hypothetical protein
MTVPSVPFLTAPSTSPIPSMDAIENTGRTETASSAVSVAGVSKTSERRDPVVQATSDAKTNAAAMDAAATVTNLRLNRDGNRI